MTKEEHLQQQCNLLFNALVNLAASMGSLGDCFFRNTLNKFGEGMQEAFNDLDAKYLASSVPDEKGEK